MKSALQALPYFGIKLFWSINCNCIDIQRDRKMERRKDGKTERRKDGKMERWKDGKKEKQKDRQTDR